MKHLFCYFAPPIWYMIYRCAMLGEQNGDAEYLRNCNAGIFPKWICRNISEVMLDVGISPKYQCRNISEIT